MVDAFERASGHFGARLLEALRAGAAQGGEAGPLHSAGLLIVREVSWPIADLRVDWSDEDPIAGLAALWDIYAPQIDDYVRRALDPGVAPSFGVPGECRRRAQRSGRAAVHRRRMKFTLRQLSYFIAAAETGSITLASKRANISQPAISTAISHIERELNVQLFLRHHAQGLSLTPAGRTLLRETKQLLKQAEGLYSAAADISHQMRGELTVGWFSTLAPIVMPELVQSFLKAFPDTQVRSEEGHQEGCSPDCARRASSWPLPTIWKLETTSTFSRWPAYRRMSCSPPITLWLVNAHSS
jgi:molybdenum-dependent DNA-binding transcriptional regulator ModE